jgi:hypothetical protein
MEYIVKPTSSFREGHIFFAGREVLSPARPLHSSRHGSRHNGLEKQNRAMY